MIVRQATLADAPGIVDAHIRSILELAAPSYSAEQIAAWRHGIGPHSHDEAIQTMPFFVAEAEDGRIAGFGTLEPEHERLGLLYVHPDFARQGVGKLLCNHIEAEAARRGQTRIWLDSSISAREFYLAIGYREIGRTDNVWQGVAFERYLMEKQLTPR